MSDNLNKLEPLDLSTPGVSLSELVGRLLKHNLMASRAMRWKERNEPNSIVGDAYQKLFVAVDRSIRGLVQEQTRRALAIASISRTARDELSAEEANKALEQIVQSRVALMSPRDLRRLADAAEALDDASGNP